MSIKEDLHVDLINVDSYDIFQHLKDVGIHMTAEAMTRENKYFIIK